MKALCVLVVEDDALSRWLVRDILRMRGHEVVEAETIEEGRAALRRQPIDVVLLDIQVPGGGGELLLAEIRQDPDRGGMAVIAVTALAMQGDRERLLAAGFDAYVSKPIDTRSFSPTIESVASERRGPLRSVSRDG